MTTENPGSKATARAPSNIAFVKYWGATDLERAIPENPSISMSLESAWSRTTVAFEDGGSEPLQVSFRAEDTLAPAPEGFVRRVAGHLERIAAWAGKKGSFRVASENSFPSDAGMASSASGFAALALATTRALGIEPTPEEMSMLARMSGSGSASRSVFGGYVQWPSAGGGATDEERCFAEQLHADTHWELCDVIAVVDAGPKSVSSLDGHRRATTSPHFARRQELLAARLEGVRKGIRERDLSVLGPIVEEEALELHLIAMSSRPAIHYWKAGTVAVLETVRGLRAEGVQAWATMDAGPNVHVICEPGDRQRVAEALEALPSVARVFSDRVGAGPVFEDAHLF